ncbi:MAG: type II secretion system major pseudopilin GspG [Planctomycetota bacterium]
MTRSRRFISVSRRGLTLVEMLAVLVLLGLIAGVLTVGIAGSLGEGRVEIARTNMAIIQQKLEQFRTRNGSWPAAEIGLQALTDGQASPQTSYYLRPDQLNDPWGNPYLLIIPGPGEFPYEILCYGADGQPGGTGEDADLSSTTLGQRDGGGN